GGGRLERQRQAGERPVSIRIAIPGVVEELPCLCWIVIEGEYVRFERPVRGRQHADGRRGKSPSQILDNGPPIDGEADRPAHAKILQDGIAEVEGEVLVVQARCCFEG